MTALVTVRGVPGSPYTRKMVALLRYRRIPYRWVVAGHGQAKSLPMPKVELLPTVYIHDGSELEALVDSTPIIRRLEAEALERSVVPDDPAVAFIDELLEDFGDEWLTKAMFHYRWQYREDIEKAGDILPRWSDVTAPESVMQASKHAFSERQISRLYVVGSNDVTRPVIEASYVRTLHALSRLLESQPFLLGSRPGAADFAVYGQLTQLALFDPTPMAVTLREAPRVYAWTEVMDDLSGLDVDEGGWLSREQLPVLRPLLEEIGRGYVPVMLANADALASGADAVRTQVDGQPWEQRPFPYQGKCLQWLRASYHRLDAADRAAVEAVVAGSGIEHLWQARH